jgi:dihydroorotate dehydrogenase (fumarate)
MIQQLEHPLMNGAGCVKLLEDAHKMARSAVSAVVLGSITVEARIGNEGTTFTRGEGFALNALGLPNPGLDYYRVHLRDIHDACRYHKKPLIVSIAGFSKAEFFHLAEVCQHCGVDAIELNFGCPNAQSEHPIWSFDPDAMRYVICSVLPEFGGAIGVKLSPFSNPDDLVRAASAIPGGVEYVATSNTFPNADAWESTRHPLTAEYAGMSGKALKPIALGQVRKLRELLDKSVHVVGVGGVESRSDIHDYFQAGAGAVQATTPYWLAGNDPMVFSDILGR